MAHKTGLEEYYIIKNNKKMRYGYTTGSSATAAAKAAVKMLLSKEAVNTVSLMTPKGILLNLEILHINIEENQVSCAVKKDGGDDPDMTNGLEIFALVKKTKQAGVFIDGGEGVGRITKNGLEQPIGNAAINQVPRRMITKEVEEICSQYEYEGGISVLIFVPKGEEIAKKTFNPKLGIVGGISILGTSGIVEPMSEAALIRSIGVEMRQRIANGSEYLLVTPGNYGSSYLKEELKLPLAESLKCSNDVGETVDMAVDMGAKGILFVAHLGKFVKVAGGIMNTHSRSANARAELMAANAIRAGASLETAKQILDTVTTDEAVQIAKEAGILRGLMQEITIRIEESLNHRSYGRLVCGAVIFSNEHGYLGQTEHADMLMKEIRKKTQKEEKT